MKQRNKSCFNDLANALRLLTRLPLPQSSDSPPGPAAAWAWPLAGGLLGGIAALLAAGLLALGLGAGVVAGLVLGAQVMLTGAMHEDGLADTADGLWGGWTPARRLEIMKDSHIGSYGVMALILVTGLRWLCLSGLIAAGAFWALVAVGAMSRAPMAVLMALLPNARGAGLAHSVGAVPRGAALVAVLIGGAAMLGLGLAGAVALLAAAMAVLALAALARARIGGQTGDILGASQQLSETAALIVLVAML